MGDLIKTLLGHGRIKDAQEITQFLLTEAATRGFDVNEAFAMTVERFIKLAKHPPSLPGWDNFAWGRAMLERNRH